MRLRLQFSLRTLLAIMTIVCLFVAWRFTSARRQDYLDSAKLADHLLRITHLHVPAADNGAAFNNPVRKYVQDIVTRDASEYTADYLLPTGSFVSGGVPSSFELDLLKKWSGGRLGTSSEVLEWPFLLKDSHTYYRAYHANGSCATCHAKSLPPGKPGELIAILRIDFPTQ